jgi:hypothetical protein
MSFTPTQFNRSSSSKKSSPLPSIPSGPPRKKTPQEIYEDGLLGFVFRTFIFGLILALFDQLAPHEIDETNKDNKDKNKGKWVTNKWWLVPIIIFSILLGVDVLYTGYGGYVTYYLKPAVATATAAVQQNV